MSNRMSPFAALTGAEKQMKWLEYQSIRLPYVHSETGDLIDDEARDRKMANAAVEPPKAQAEPKQSAAPQQRTQAPQMTQSEAQKIRHRQYDAVIARMKQAELQTNNRFTPFS